jgi:hypothetical protein
MKKYILIATILSVVILNLSCKSKEKDKPVEAGDPKAMVKTFMEKVAAGEFSDVEGMITTESSLVFSLLKSNKQEAEKGMSADSIARRNAEGIPGAVYQDAVLGGEEAYVIINDTIHGSEAKIWLKKEGGRWKINLQKAQ